MTDVSALPPSYDYDAGTDCHAVSAGQSSQKASAPSQQQQPQQIIVEQKQVSYDDIKARWSKFVKERELNPAVADRLWNVMQTTDVVLLCDDSDSMAQAIAEEGTDPFAAKRSTRWLELKKLAASIIQVVTSATPHGMDVAFLNRPMLVNVTSPAGLQAAFSLPPTGSTPLVSHIELLHQAKSQMVQKGRKLLLVVITDGEPAGGPKETREQLRQCLTRITSDGRTHVSFAECTDQADDMEYLDLWDGVIQNFDNTEDYREELQRVKNVQGQNFKFDFSDYVAKILLATFDRWFFNLDQTKVADNRGIQSLPVSNQLPTQQWQPNGYGYNPQQQQPQQSQYYQQGQGQGQQQYRYQPPPQQAENCCCTLL